MGFLSKIFKPIKKIFKGVGKIVKKVFKEVKRFAKSDLGKALITAAAIYFGGQALGLFGQGSATASSVPIVESTPAALGQAAGETAVASTAGAGSAAAGATATAGSVASAAPASGAATATGLGSGGFSIAGITANAAPAIPGLTSQVSAEATKTLMARALDAIKATGKWMADNPIPTLAAGRFLSSALAPDPVEEQLKFERQRRAMSNVGGVDYGDVYGGAAPLRTAITSDLQKQDLDKKTYG